MKDLPMLLVTFMPTKDSFVAHAIALQCQHMHAQCKLFFIQYIHTLLLLLLLYTIMHIAYLAQNHHKVSPTYLQNTTLLPHPQYLFHLVRCITYLNDWQATWNCITDCITDYDFQISQFSKSWTHMVPIIVQWLVIEEKELQFCIS